MGKKLIIIGADFFQNSIVERPGVCVVENRKTGYYINSSGVIKNFPSPQPPYCDIVTYRVTPGKRYVLHGPTPVASAYGVMAKFTKINPSLNETYTLYSGPQLGQSASYTYEFIADGELIGLNDNEYELGTHSYIEPLI